MWCEQISGLTLAVTHRSISLNNSRGKTNAKWTEWATEERFKCDCEWERWQPGKKVWNLLAEQLFLTHAYMRRWSPCEGLVPFASLHTLLIRRFVSPIPIHLEHWSCVMSHDTMQPVKNINCQSYIKCPRSRTNANKAFSSTRHVTPFGTQLAHISNADHVHQFDLFIWIGFLHLLTEQRDCQILINATQLLLLLCALELLFSTPGDTSRCAHHMPNPRETRSKHISRQGLHCTRSQKRHRKPMLLRTHIEHRRVVPTPQNVKWLLSLDKMA